jgi:hypothetical protein
MQGQNRLPKDATPGIFLGVFLLGTSFSWANPTQPRRKNRYESDPQSEWHPLLLQRRDLLRSVSMRLEQLGSKV